MAQVAHLVCRNDAHASDAWGRSHVHGRGVCAGFFRCVLLIELVRMPGRLPVAGAAPPKREGDRLVVDIEAAGMRIRQSYL